MPLLDHLGREITPARSVKRHKTPRPNNRKAPRRVPKAATETARRNLAPVTHVELMLSTRHNLSGHLYGPGKVVVTQDVAQVLREGERRAQAVDERFTQPRACMIGPGGTKGGLSVREVAPEYFDTNVSNGVPFGVVDRATGQFSPY